MEVTLARALKIKKRIVERILKYDKSTCVVVIIFKSFKFVAMSFRAVFILILLIVVNES